ncbi:MAG: Dipeptide transport system permease protein DppC, partial [uncultured Thermomicrobiales bacterium]
GHPPDPSPPSPRRRGDHRDARALVGRQTTLRPGTGRDGRRRRVTPGDRDQRGPPTAAASSPRRPGRPRAGRDPGRGGAGRAGAGAGRPGGAGPDRPAGAAGLGRRRLGPPPRHRPPGARPAGPDGGRGAGLAAGRGRGDAGRRSARGGARTPRREHPGLGRPAGHLGRRRPARAAVRRRRDRRRHDARPGGRHGGPDPGGDRMGGVRPDRPPPGPGAAGGAVRRGRAERRGRPRPPGTAPYASEPARPGGGRGQPAGRGDGALRGGAELPRPRRAGRDDHLGRDDRRRPGDAGDRLVGLGGARSRACAGGTRRQPARRLGGERRRGAWV